MAQIYMAAWIVAPLGIWLETGQALVLARIEEAKSKSFDGSVQSSSVEYLGKSAFESHWLRVAPR